MLLTEIMSDYLSESSSTFEVENSFKPLSPKESLWQQKEGKLKRVFEFEEMRQLEAFIVEMLKYNREADALIDIRFKNNIVSVVIEALSGTVSEIEVEASREINHIRRDVVYYHAKRK